MIAPLDDSSPNRAMVEVIQPPMDLARKTGVGRSIDPMALERAVADLGRMGEEYLDDTARDLALLKGLTAAANAADRPLAELYGRIRAVVHDMRGVGGSFGFVLAGQMADSLHRLLTLRPEDAPLPAVAAHIDSLRAPSPGG
jgi:hypothetical protein